MQTLSFVRWLAALCLVSSTQVGFANLDHFATALEKITTEHFEVLKQAKAEEQNRLVKEALEKEEQKKLQALKEMLAKEQEEKQKQLLAMTEKEKKKQAEEEEITRALAQETKENQWKTDPKTSFEELTDPKKFLYGLVLQIRNDLKTKKTSTFDEIWDANNLQKFMTLMESSTETDKNYFANKNKDLVNTLKKFAENKFMALGDLADKLGSALTLESMESQLNKNFVEPLSTTKKKFKAEVLEEERQNDEKAYRNTFATLTDPKEFFQTHMLPLLKDTSYAKWEDAWNAIALEKMLQEIKLIQTELYKELTTNIRYVNLKNFVEKNFKTVQEAAAVTKETNKTEKELTTNIDNLVKKFQDESSETVD